jgi:hypothetical protein
LDVDLTESHHLQFLRSYDTVFLIDDSGSVSSEGRLSEGLLLITR